MDSTSSDSGRDDGIGIVNATVSLTGEINRNDEPTSTLTNDGPTTLHAQHKGEELLHANEEDSNPLYNDQITNYQRDIFPYRNKFMLKISCSLIVQIIFLVMSLTLTWVRWQVILREVIEESPIDVDFYMDFSENVWDIISSLKELKIFELNALFIFGAVIQPIVKVVSFSLVQKFFYEGTSVKWYPRDDVDYAKSCDEKSLLPWLRDDVQASFRTLPGQLKLAHMAVDFLERNVRFSFAQTCLNALTVYALTTKTTEHDNEDVKFQLWAEMEWGYIAVDLFNIIAAANTVMIRWEMNRWIRWYRRETVARSRYTAQVMASRVRNNQVASTAEVDETDSLTKPLIQSEMPCSVEQNVDDDDEMIDLHPKLQIFWYLAAAGCVVSIAPLICGIDIFETEYRTYPISEDKTLSFVYRSDSLYSFLRSQYFYIYESWFAFRAIQFIAIVVVCFIIPFVLTILCLVIEMRKDRMSDERMRFLVCTLQYLRLLCGSESFVAAFIVFYFEIERMTEGLIYFMLFDLKFYLVVKFNLVPGTWFMMTWMICLYGLHTLTFRKYRRYTLQV